MTQLFIKKTSGTTSKYMEVALPDDWSTTLTIENVYFTKSSEYTYDCKLPLSTSSQNQKIFGCLHRRDVAKKGDTYVCLLKVNNRNVIENGTATVTDITENEITLQLLGGNADVNFRTRLDNLYIDEMPLGNAMDDINAFCNKYSLIYYNFETSIAGLRSWIKWAEGYGKVTSEETESAEYKETGLIADTVMRTSDDFPFVMMSAYDPYLSKAVNVWSSIRDYCGGGTSEEDNYGCFYRWPKMMRTMSIIDSTETTTVNPEDIVYCPQPFLVYIAEIIFKALGFSIEKNEIRNTALKNTYFCNTTETVKYNEMLPHWTVNDFITEFENFFGCIVIFKGTKAYIYTRENYYAQESPITLSKVNDNNWNCETQDDELEEVSSSTISFKMYEEDLTEKFDDTINGQAILVEDNDPTTRLNSTIEPYRHATLVQKDDGTQWYASGSTSMEESVVAVEGNQLRNLDRGEDSNEIELKISPSKLFAYMYAQSLNGDSKFYKMYNITTPQSPSNPLKIATINIEQYLEDEDFEADEKESTMVVAVWDGIEQPPIFKTSGTGRYPTWSGWTHGYNKRDQEIEPEPTNLLRLVNIVGKNTLGNCYYGENTSDHFNSKIDAKIQIEIEFFDNHENFDLRKPFIFCGHLYVCHHLEVTITPKGYNESKKGIFYRVR